jgi:hypothetical protein
MTYVGMPQERKRLGKRRKQARYQISDIRRRMGGAATVGPFFFKQDD